MIFVDLTVENNNDNIHVENHWTIGKIATMQNKDYITRHYT